jgi:hypothetical protein
VPVRLCQGALTWADEERAASVCGLCAGESVYGATTIVAHARGVVRPQQQDDADNGYLNPNSAEHHAFLSIISIITILVSTKYFGEAT